MAGIKKGIPAVKAAITNTLNTNLNAQITAINSAWSDNITLATIGGSPNLTLYRGQKEVIPEYPAITVAWAPESSILADAAPLWQNIDHIYEVAVTCLALDELTVQDMVERYLVAIWEVLVQSPFLDNSLSGLIGLSLTKAGKSKIYKDNLNQFLHSGAWYATVNLDESA